MTFWDLHDMTERKPYADALTSREAERAKRRRRLARKQAERLQQRRRVRPRERV